MKLFFGKFLLFILLFLVSDFILGLVVSDFHLNTKNTQLTNANHGFLNYSNEDVLFFGASEVSHSFISSRVTDKTGLSSYNLASNGCGIYYQYPLLETILDKHVPKIILLSSAELNEFGTDYVSRMYPYYKTNKYVKEIVDEIYPNEYLKLALQGYIYNSKIIRIFDDKDENSKGYIAIPQKASKTNNSQFQELPLGIEYSITEDSKKYFIKFIERATARGTTVYVCIPPALEKINEKYLNKVKSIVESTDARLINFSKDASFLDRKELFYDQTHLNHAGAEIITDRFIDILKEDKAY